MIVVGVFPAIIIPCEVYQVYDYFPPLSTLNRLKEFQAIFELMLLAVNVGIL